jgi:endonuclease/exonuclease/phosphatase family metal-dependent hydrolase
MWGFLSIKKGFFSMKIMTCNVRYGGADDGPNAWPHRQDFLADVIGVHDPDIIGFQEMWVIQFSYLKESLGVYDAYGMADEPLNHNPTNAIFYRRGRFAPVSAGGYWLSESPHVAGSKSWDNSTCCPRLANWLRLHDLESGEEFRFINTHLDHEGQKSRENQAHVINEDAAAYPADYAQILTGDMNADAANPAIQTFKAGGWQDSYESVHGPEDPGYTFHEFMGSAFGEHGIGKIDWVFVRGSVTVKAAAIVDDSREGCYPSDHYFVTAEIEL